MGDPRSLNLGAMDGAQFHVTHFHIGRMTYDQLMQLSSESTDRKGRGVYVLKNPPVIEYLRKKPNRDVLAALQSHLHRVPAKLRLSGPEYAVVDMPAGVLQSLQAGDPHPCSEEGRRVAGASLRPRPRPRPRLEDCDESTFLADLVWFHWSNGEGGKAIAHRVASGLREVNKSPVDYFTLYKAVALQGGLPGRNTSSTGSRNRYKRQGIPFTAIFRAMSNFFEGHRATSVGNSLINIYEGMLLEYERGHPEDVSPVEHWIQCDNEACGKWRSLPLEVDVERLPPHWECTMHPDPGERSCSAAQAWMGADVR